VIEALTDAIEIAYAVTVRVSERSDVDLIDDGVLPPMLRIHCPNVNIGINVGSACRQMPRFRSA
jgi:hypothetical protein